VAILRAGVWLLLAGCYTPDLRDCSVTCTSDEDCAVGHVCGDRGLCVRPEGTCGVAQATDGGPTVADASPPSDPPPDAPLAGVLRIKIGDQGRVIVPGVGTCERAITDQCDFVIDRGVPLTLTAEPYPTREFDLWAKACSGAGHNTVCMLTPNAPLTEVEAKFRKID
jgi:hypothetical protein